MAEPLKIKTSSLFKNGFRMGNIATNEYSQTQLGQLEIAEQNLSKNMDNSNLMKKFLLVAENVKVGLKEKYGDFWIDPSES